MPAYVSGSPRTTSAALAPSRAAAAGSEEHTSELQSQSNLVCRLLLEENVTSEEEPGLRAASGLFLLVKVLGNCSYFLPCRYHHWNNYRHQKCQYYEVPKVHRDNICQTELEKEACNYEGYPSKQKAARSDTDPEDLHSLHAPPLSDLQNLAEREPYDQKDQHCAQAESGAGREPQG